MSNSDNIDVLIAATKSKTQASVIIEGYNVRIVPNPYSDRNLYSLFIGNCQSNSRLEGAMRSLLRAWKEGKYRIAPFEGEGLLMKTY